MVSVKNQIHTATRKTHFKGFTDLKTWKDYLQKVVKICILVFLPSGVSVITLPLLIIILDNDSSVCHLVTSGRGSLNFLFHFLELNNNIALQVGLS